jgi:hypothetical protein
LIFEPVDAVAIAFLLVLLVLSGRGCLMLWRTESAKPYLDRVAVVLPWLSERALVQCAAALPTFAIGMAGLTTAVIAGYLGISLGADAAVTGLAALVVAGFGIFLLAIPVAVSTALVRRPRLLVPPPLRRAARPSGGGAGERA